MKKVVSLVVVSVLLAGAVGFMSIYLDAMQQWSSLYDNAPHHPDAATGAVVAFNNHGTLLYVNQARLDVISRRETWSFFNGFVCMVLLAGMARSSVGTSLRGRSRIALVVPVVLGAANYFYWSTRF